MPEHTDVSSAQPRRRIVYYDAGGTVVTNAYVRSVHGYFPVAELSRISRSMPYGHPGRTVAVIVGGIELAAVAPLAIAYRSLTVFGFGILIAIVVAIGVLADGRRNPEWSALLARHRGVTIKIYSTRDRREFERVRWAVVHAVEDCRASSY